MKPITDEELVAEMPDDYVVRIPPVSEYTLLCYSNIVLWLDKRMSWFYLYGKGLVEIDECPFCGGSLDGRCYCYGKS
jgi:hypothetical protein